MPEINNENLGKNVINRINSEKEFIKGKEKENKKIIEESQEWNKNQDGKIKERDIKIKRSFSKIDKLLENFKNMPNLEKEQPEITWPEMHNLIQPQKNRQREINSPWVFNLAKTLSFGSQNRLNDENLQNWLNIGDQKFANGEIPEEEWIKIGGLIDKELTKRNRLKEKIEMVKEMGASKINEQKDIPLFFKQRLEQEKELQAIFRKDEKDLIDRDMQRTAELVDSLYKRPLSEMDLGFMGSSGEKPPKVEEVGITAYKKWFEDKIHALIKDYPDQNFETNWTLTLTLQQAVINIYSKDGEDKFKYKDKDIDGNDVIKEGSYTELRGELALKLEAYRAIHNFIYLYRRVPGVGEAIGPAGLLEAKYLQHLLREKGKDKDNKDYSVADALRRLYKKGEDYRLVKGEDEKSENSKKEFVKEAIEIQEENWQGRVAGALYSAFQGTARDGGLSLNQGGDFFIGRLYNMTDWVKKAWEGQCKRKPWPGMYKALDLKVNDFWTKTLEHEELGYLKKDLKIEVEEGFNGKKIYRFEEAKFEDIDLLKNKYISSDHLKHVILDLEEADNIRKMILNPRGLIDEPKFGHIKMMWEKFKHLKGKERSEWFSPVIKELSLFFRDKVAPWNDSLPSSMRRCQAQEVYPYINAMDNEQIIDNVMALTPPLNPEDAEEVLRKVVGPKVKRGLEKTTRVVGGTVWAMITEGIKAALGIK